MPLIDPYLGACAAFGRAARAGVASVMAHYTRPQGPMALVDEAREIARAAADVGVRATLAVAMRDRNPLVYGDAAALLTQLPPDARAAMENQFFAPTLSASEQVARVESIAAAVENSTFTVQFGPTGAQWCSDALRFLFHLEFTLGPARSFFQVITLTTCTLIMGGRKRKLYHFLTNQSFCRNINIHK